MSSILLWANLICSLYMTGLICFVQVVHYPLFELVGREGFTAYAAAHTARTVWVTAPVMLVELAVSLLLVWQPPPGIPAAWMWSIAGLTVLLWASTFLLQVPQHALLSNGFDTIAWQRLVHSNRIRTLLWCLKSTSLIYLVARKLR